MGTRGRWRAWLAGVAVILGTFGLAWWNNPANIGTAREAQRAWLAMGYSTLGVLALIGPLSMRTHREATAQRTLIIALALFVSVCVWWVGYLPSDPFGCSRVDDPDCHTNAVTRWRALAEGVGVFFVAFVATHAIGRLVERRRTKQAVGQPAR